MSDYYRPTGFGGFSFFPPVIKNLLIINGVVFLFQMLGEQISLGNGLTISDMLTKYFALIPLGGLTLSNGLGQISQWNFYPWQLISYQFMHGGFMHIAMNMFILWMFGMEIENIWGSKKFLTFYLVCGVAAGIAQLLLPPLFNEQLAPTIGASGAIFGVLIAFGIIFPNRYIFLWFFIPIKAKYLTILFVLVELYSIPHGGDVAHLAHLGGALAGFIYIMIDKKRGTLYGNYFSGSSSKRGSTIIDSLKNVSNVFSRKEGSSKKSAGDVEDARYYEINDNNREEEITQAEIDKILDKISQSGYQNLTDKEKRILFEASKKMK